MILAKTSANPTDGGSPSEFGSRVEDWRGRQGLDVQAPRTRSRPVHVHGARSLTRSLWDQPRPGGSLGLVPRAAGRQA